MEKLNVLKIGGNVIDHEEKLDEFIKVFSRLEGPKILVHGGGKIATKIGEKLGIKARMVEGRRVTDRETLDIVTMVYGGLVNKGVVSKLQAKGCNAIGLTGADGNVIEAHKRPVADIDYGWVGDVDRVNIEPLVNFIKQGITPVFAALTHDGKGHMLNTNADTIATMAAVGLSAAFEVNLIYCFEKKGVLEDIDNPDSLIQSIDYAQYQSLKEAGIIADGMIPKLDNAFNAIQKGVSSVKICAADELSDWIEKGDDIGTTLR